MRNNQGLLEHEENAEYYYHGTSKKYFSDQLKKYGKYRHDNMDTGESVFVSTCYGGSENYAKDRSSMYSAIYNNPIVLKINGDKVRGRVHQHPVINDICINYLLEGEFEVVDVP